MINLYPHQLKLINEVKQAFIDKYKSPCIVSPCGSGKSIMIGEIARLTTAKQNRVLFLVHRKELKDQIYSTFKKMKVDMMYADVMMVQTAVKRLNKIKYPQLIITDENHHTLAKTYKKIYQYFCKAKLLGFTATPVRLNGGGLGDVNDKLIIGPSVKWLIDNSYLSPYKYYAPKMVDTSHLKTSKGDFVVKDINIESKIYGDVIGYYKKLSNQQAICYCSTIAHSEEMAKRFNHAGINAVHFDSNTSKYKREKIIQDFREQKIRILTNVDLIGEGFDVPDCSTVIMLRPTKSLSLFIQQSMRGMRYKKNKVSVIIDHVGNIERFGLPDMDRVWSLNPKKENGSKKQDEIPIKVCPNCFSAIDKKETVCPVCNQILIAEAKFLEEDTSEQLREYTKDDFDFTLNTKDYRECKSMRELINWCLSNGYKKGYAYYLGKNIGLLA